MGPRVRAPWRLTSATGWLIPALLHGIENGRMLEHAPQMLDLPKGLPRLG